MSITKKDIVHVRGISSYGLYMPDDELDVLDVKERPL